jgi:hypothetical protein
MIFNHRWRQRATQGYAKVSSWWPVRLTASTPRSGLLPAEVHSRPRRAAAAARAEVSRPLWLLMPLAAEASTPSRGGRSCF